MSRSPLAATDARRALPYRVGVGIRRRIEGDPPALCPSEETDLGPKAAARRRSSFALGRAAARDALSELGISATAIRRGPAGEPVWPDGIVGAISHTGDVAVAIVGRLSDYAGLGIDLEQLSPGLSGRAARLVCTPSEMEWVGEAAGTNRGTMLFSAKEAVFKALFPIERVWLGFGDAELEWRAEPCAFEARLLKTASRGYPSGSVLQVQCTLTDAEVLSTTYALPESATGASLHTPDGCGRR